MIALFLQRELNVTERTGASEHRQRLEHLWQLVSEDMARDWDIHTLARAGGFSHSYLHAVTRRIYGHGVMEMVLKLRMERAASLILTRHEKLAVVAEQVGYQSHDSFSRAFKRYMGTAPDNYRQLHGPPARTKK